MIAARMRADSPSAAPPPKARLVGAAMLRLLGDRSLRRRMGMAGRRGCVVTFRPRRSIDASRS